MNIFIENFRKMGLSSFKEELYKNLKGFDKISFGLIKNPTKEVFHMYHNYHFTKRNMEQLLKERSFEILDYKQDSLPIHTVEGNFVKKGLLALLYFISALINKQIDMVFIAKKI